MSIGLMASIIPITGPKTASLRLSDKFTSELVRQSIQLPQLDLDYRVNPQFSHLIKHRLKVIFDE
ncbi:hypothetical protein [Burkholderia pseudomultivorans]|uniref:hypothetical protein n=1 Tax=Burkholderia pseudomultivorans TaxID=1207504 RepID=UPI0012DA01FE|nr:hypothetical protein [Burkholderia pseudomultivorans]